ncbi:MAG: menaquinone biosynthetic enzyme MqnA/MqnD family protein [Planctomycetaceae bacterium]
MGLIGNLMEYGDYSTPRIGAVSYLNSKPLIEGLTAAVPVSLDYPSCLADNLANDRLDVALVPSIEFFRDPNYRIVSDACVATRGAVRSVKLYSRVPPGEINRLALDEGSRTSATMAKIILAERYGVFPQLEPLPMEYDTAQTDADAILLIGDRAMSDPDEVFVETWDLGSLWTEWTGLPFVFAMWVARGDANVVGLANELATARDRGVAAFDSIALREAESLGLNADDAEDYLRNNLHFYLGSAERQGLRLFEQLASKLGLIPESQTCVRDYAIA